jgi:PAS domain S-box-containing protein
MSPERRTKNKLADLPTARAGALARCDEPRNMLDWPTFERARCVSEQTNSDVYSLTAIAAAQERLTRLLDEMPQLVWSSSPEGEVMNANRRCLDYTGLDVTDKKNGGWAKVLHPEDSAKIWEMWKYSAATGQGFHAEYRMLGKDRIFRWFLGQVVPIRDDAGAITEWFGSATDIDAQKRAELELERTRAPGRGRTSQVRGLVRGVAGGDGFTQGTDTHFRKGERELSEHDRQP